MAPTPSKKRAHASTALSPRPAKHTKPSHAPPSSPFIRQRTSLYLPLSPVGAAQPLESLCAEHLSPLLLTYVHSLRGVVLSYADVVLSTTQAPNGDEPAFAKAHGEYATPYVWLTATFTLFRPRRGVRISGHVNVSSASHIGLICYNLFNANVQRKDMPLDWEWKAQGTPNGKAASKQKHAEDEGLGEWLDEQGKPVARTEPLEFCVQDFESAGHWNTHKAQAGLLDIEGSLTGGSTGQAERPNDKKKKKRPTVSGT